MEENRKPKYPRKLYKMYVVDKDLKLHGTFLTHVYESRDYLQVKDTMMSVADINKFTVFDITEAMRGCIHINYNDIELYCITSDNQSDDFMTIKNRILKEKENGETK